MSFSTCKYDRELLFFWSKIENLRSQLDSIDDTKGSDEDRKIASGRKEEIVKEIETLSELQHDIEKTYHDVDMSDYLEDMRSRRKAPMLDLTPSEYKEKGIETDEGSDDTNSISSINTEISELEASLVMAQIYEDNEKCNKIEMSLSVLRSRRSDLMDMTRPDGSADEGTSDEYIEEMKKDISSLRTQIGNLRGDMLDLREMVTRIAHHLGLDQER